MWTINEIDMLISALEWYSNQKSITRILDASLIAILCGKEAFQEFAENMKKEEIANKEREENEKKKIELLKAKLILLKEEIMKNEEGKLLQNKNKKLV